MVTAAREAKKLKYKYANLKNIMLFPRFIPKRLFYVKEMKHKRLFQLNYQYKYIYIYIYKFLNNVVFGEG